MTKDDTLYLMAENERLRLENERLRNSLMAWDPHYLLRQDLPTPAEALVIWKRITSKYPRMKSWSDSETDQAAGLVAAMAFTFTLNKTKAPDSRYDGDIWISHAVNFCSRQVRIFVPRIRSLLLGIIATNDVPWALSNDDIFLDLHGSRGGTPIDRSKWRALLDGAPLPAPVTLKPKMVDGSIGGIRVQGVNAW